MGLNYKNKPCIIVTKKLSAFLSAFKDTRVREKVEKIDKEVFEIMEAVR
ncbi:MAG: hypothetical protein HZA06_06865 [Nitrospirae bacterium]|nr:hypothetical protein [Nitrospirota bacterium]